MTPATGGNAPALTGDASAFPAGVWGLLDGRHLHREWLLGDRDTSAFTHLETRAEPGMRALSALDLARPHVSGLASGSGASDSDGMCPASFPLVAPGALRELQRPGQPETEAPMEYLLSQQLIARSSNPIRFVPVTAPVRRWLGAGLGLLGAGLVAAWSAPAAAQTTIGVGLNYNDVVDESGTDAGAGVDIYFGPRLDLAILALTTELSGGFHDFGGPLEPTAYRAMAGGRLGLGFIIRPSVFAHAGVGHLRYDELIGTGRDGRTNVAMDLGVALDFTVLPLIDLGIQTSYNTILGGEDSAAFEWVQAGAHVTFVLDDA